MENEEMKDRIAHIIRAKNLTAAEFAIRLGIQPSNISHLLSGRNNPSLDFVRKLKETFPEYNLDWIIFGTGPMTVSEPFLPPTVVTDSPVAKEREEEINFDSPAEPSFDSEEQPAPMSGQPLPSLHSGWKKLILVYEDNTFEVLSPR
jgi:transcriptional regulator with XRE-family HTH domain